MVGIGVVEKFKVPAKDLTEIIYKPHLLRVGTVNFKSTKANSEWTETTKKVNAILPTGIDFQKELTPPLPTDEFSDEPVSGSKFADLPGFAMNADTYKKAAKDFSSWLEENERASLFYCPELKAYSTIGQTQGDFRASLNLRANEARDNAVKESGEKFNAKIKAIQNRLETSERSLEKEKAESGGAMMKAGNVVLGKVLDMVKDQIPALKLLLGRKRSSSASTITQSTQAYKQHKDVQFAEDKVESLKQEIVALEAEAEADKQTIIASYDKDKLTIDDESVKPKKADIKVTEVCLLWIPETR